ncbi:MAG: DUF2339 domain-containing protein, partial [Actinobacteria bacterium]|nr:DUF2339 domain-containing protein [Actinomycetota bacterium]
MEAANDSRPEGDHGLEGRVLRLEGEVARLRAELARVAEQNAGAAQPARRVAPPPPVPAAVPELVFARDAANDVRAPEVPGAETAGVGAEVNWGGPDSGRNHDAGVSFENRLGSQWFNRIGIVLLLLGTSWFLKLAVDRGWIVPSPTVRVIAGLVAGAALVLWSERFRRNGFAAFSYSLKALGSGVLYLSLWAGFRLYGLLPAAVALGLMIAVTAWNAFMAWAQDAQLLAAYALAGGYATPMLLSTGGNHEVFLFTYLLAMDAATVVLVRLKRWPRLLLAASAATVGYFAGWYVMYWRAEELAVTTLFVVAFGVVFGSVPLGVGEETGTATGQAGQSRGMLLRETLGPLANAAFVGLALYSVLQDSGHHDWLPWMVLV